MTRTETLAAAERWKPVPGYENEACGAEIATSMDE